MIRRPPRSTPLSLHDALPIFLEPLWEQRPDRAVRHPRRQDLLVGRAALATRRSRSEEHTSELQSPCNLVCRLLLEKKKDGTAHGYTDNVAQINCSDLTLWHGL